MDIDEEPECVFIASENALKCYQCGKTREEHRRHRKPIPATGVCFGNHDPSPNNRERWDLDADELRTNY